MLTAQFSTTDEPASAAIRWATNGRYSHVDLVLPNGLLGAHLEGGVQLRPFGYANFTATERVYCEVPNESVALAFAIAQIGKPYNGDALLDMVLHRERKFAMEQSSWFCDELLYAAALAGGVRLLNTDNPLSLTPWEVYLSPYWKKENQ